MSDDDREDRPSTGFASPPCYAHEIAPEYFDPLAVDPVQARDVARWRKAERARLLDARRAMSVAGREELGAAILRHVSALVAELCPDPAGHRLAGVWPIKGEPDLRPLMRDWHAVGAEVALPVVETRHAPLVFRRWTPQTAMVRGDWGIPVPGPDAAALVPELALAPLVGWDAAGYRLGYGGGYFDRTLAAASPRPFTIGIGCQSARLATIFPQPHDIGLDAIVTEAGVQFLRDRT